MTIAESLDRAHPATLPDRLRKIQIGTFLAGLIPQDFVRSGLSSSATHVEEPGIILSVASSGNTTLTIVHSADTAGAGEVKVTYDSEGIATLVFGDGANTGYKVTKTVFPDDLGTNLAVETGSYP